MGSGLLISTLIRAAHRLLLWAMRGLENGPFFIGMPLAFFSKAAQVSSSSSPAAYLIRPSYKDTVPFFVPHQPPLIPTPRFLRLTRISGP